MYLSHLHAVNWRNFRSIDVPLNETVYLVGPNASGKSNFLDIFRFLRDIVKDGGGLQKAVADRGGIKKVRCLAARKQTAVTLDVSLSKNHASDEHDWKYRLTFHGKQMDRVRIIEECVTCDGKLILNRPTKEDSEKDPERLTQTYLEQINSNQEFRSIADYFRDTLYLHLVPQLLKYGHQLAVQRMESDPFGQGFLEEVAATPEKTRDSRLNRIGKNLHAVVPQFERLAFKRDERTGSPHLQICFKHWRKAGAFQQEDQFSDGTLRLISLLWTLMSSNHLILLEEPELSLHGKIVEQIPQLFRKMRASRKIAGGQILVSTHSEQMLSDKSVDADSFLMVHPGADGEASGVEPLNSEQKTMIRAGLSPADVIFPVTELHVGGLDS
ncbi:MAG: AAA family ATPase [Thermoguttaceae bacterium]